MEWQKWWFLFVKVLVFVFERNGVEYTRSLEVIGEKMESGIRANRTSVLCIERMNFTPVFINGCKGGIVICFFSSLCVGTSVSG